MSECKQAQAQTVQNVDYARVAGPLAKHHQALVAVGNYSFVVDQSNILQGSISSTLFQLTPANFGQNRVEQRHILSLRLDRVREEHVYFVRDEIFDGHRLHRHDHVGTGEIVDWQRTRRLVGLLKTCLSHYL